MCYCIHEEKINVEGFTQNGCYGNQPQPYVVVFYGIDANTYALFTKQDLTVRQAYRLRFWFVFCNEPRILQFTFVFSAFYRLFFGNNFILYHIQ